MELPPYTRGEEIFNMVSHIVGGAFGAAALVICVVTAFMHDNIRGVIGGAVYGVSMITVYTISSVYHGLKINTAKKVMQVLDHCDIYFLICGSYTPILLTGCYDYKPALCWSMLAAVWGVSAAGIVFKAIDLHKYRVFTTACYFIVGWSAVFVVKPMLNAFPLRFVIWIVTGGVIYTLGMIFFGLAKRYRYFHSIFHLFILAGSVIQFFGIWFYCM